MSTPMRNLIHFYQKLIVQADKVSVKIETLKRNINKLSLTNKYIETCPPTGVSQVLRHKAHSDS